MDLNFLIRNVRKDEIGEVMRVENEACPEELRATREKFVCRHDVFPEGFLGAYVNDILAGTLTGMRTSIDPNEKLTWAEATDNGYIKNHEADGKWLYIVSLGVSGNYGGNGLGGALLSEAKKQAKEWGCNGAFLQARPCGYDARCKASGDISIQEYLKLKIKGQRIDKEIRFYEKHGFNVVKAIENGEKDRESRNYTVTMKALF